MLDVAVQKVLASARAAVHTVVGEQDMQEQQASMSPGEPVRPSVPPVVVGLAVVVVVLLAVVGVLQFLHTEFGVGLSLLEVASLLTG